MTATIESFSGPNYISSRSADVILSDVRPIKLKLDALRSINVLLDEFLYNLLNAAKSITTNKLKASLIKILPTALGKDAILEAELELKAYWERTTPSPSTRDATDSQHDFNLTWSFELLRLKCEAYTTMNDVDEDTDAERRLNDRMTNSGGGIPPQQQLLAPAALYLTAILEHICEHILSSVSRVTSRDSSRTVATVQDLFVALCEDDTMYSMFKTMRVYEQIENLSKAVPLRRSKSINRNNNGSPGASRTASPAIDLRDSASTPALHRTRMSSDSISTAVNGSGPILQRTSTEKSRVAKIMSRSSSDHGDRFESGANELNGTAQNGNSVELVEEVALQEEFDELMRSGATMKVSLTPDRLKSMDERKRTQNGGSNASRNAKNGHIPRKPSVRNVDAIAEDEEPHAPSSSPPSAFQKGITRVRQGSLSRTNSKSSSSIPPGNPRARSISVSAVPLARSKSDMPPPPLPSNMPAPSKIQKSVSDSGKMMDNGRPRRTRKIGRNRESMDLDDIMNASDDDEVAELPLAASPVTPRRPHISKAAQDLIDFLEEGPPIQPLTSVANPSMMSLESTKGKTNRFQRMVSRLAISGSKENLNGRGTTIEPPRTPKTPRSMRSPYGGSISSPPPSFTSHSLSSKRSMPNVIVATPPPRPGTFKRDDTPPPPRTVTPTPSSHASTEDMTMSPGGSGVTRRPSVPRKAVPVFDGGAISQFPLPPTRVDDVKIASQIKPNGTNGSFHGSEENGSIRQRKESSHRAESTQSPYSDVRSERSENGSPNRSLAPSPEVLQHPPARSSSKRLPHRPPRAERPVPDALQEQPEEQAKELESKEGSIDEAKETAKDETPTVTVTEPSISLSSEDVFCLRKLLGVATTAEECRLLVEMFLTKNGSANLSEPEFTPRVARFSRQPDEALKELILLNQTLELSLVGLLLGEEEEVVEESQETEASVEANIPPPAEPVPVPIASE